jgi:hypothetical protein
VANAAHLPTPPPLTDSNSSIKCSPKLTEPDSTEEEWPLIDVGLRTGIPICPSHAFEWFPAVMQAAF